MLITEVISKLQMTKEDLAMFSPPKAIYLNYTRQVIYDLRKYELDLFSLVAEFPKGRDTVKDKQKTLIMFIEYNPKYADNNYISIWFRFAKDFSINRQKVKIIKYEFENVRRSKSTEMKMSFSTNIACKEYSDDDEDYEDDEINHLSSLFSQLSIQ